MDVLVGTRGASCPAVTLLIWRGDFLSRTFDFTGSTVSEEETNIIQDVDLYG